MPRDSDYQIASRVQPVAVSPMPMSPPQPAPSASATVSEVSPGVSPQPAPNASTPTQPPVLNASQWLPSFTPEKQEQFKELLQSASIPASLFLSNQGTGAVGASVPPVATKNPTSSATDQAQGVLSPTTMSTAQVAQGTQPPKASLADKKPRKKNK